MIGSSKRSTFKELRVDNDEIVGFGVGGSGNGKEPQNNK